MAAVENTETAEGTEATAEAAVEHPRRPRLRRPTRRTTAVLAGVLAAAVLVPLAVYGLGGEPTPSAEAAKADRGPLTATEALRKARKSGQKVEAEAVRTANSTTWAQPDGLLRTRIYSDTIRARVGGEWKPIDTDLKRVEGGFAPKAVNDPLVFSAGSRQQDRSSRSSRAPLAVMADAATDEWTRLVSFTTAGHDLALHWPGPLPTPVVEGPRALYENVRPGIDLLLTARDSGYSQVLIVHNREAAADPLLDDLTYRFTSDDLTFRLDPETDVLQALDADGNEVAAAPTPFSWDSAGKSTVTVDEASTSSPSPSPVTHEVFQLEGLGGPQPGTHDATVPATLEEDGTLRLTPDGSLLTGEDTVYPVFIDPSLKGHKTDWTLLYKSYPNSSFWNGRNYNDGTNEARVGFETTSNGLSRSVFEFEFPDKIKGSDVKSAYFRALQTYSWSCSDRRYELWLTGNIWSGNTWNNQPSWKRQVDSLSNDHGYSSNCPNSWVRMNVESVAQEAADERWAKVRLGLRAANESDTYAWKKFRANGENSPYIEIEYNRPPEVPENLTMSPGPDCDTSEPYPSVGKTDLTFRARGTDLDGNLSKLHFRVWRTGHADQGYVVNTYLTPNSDRYANVTARWEDFTHGTLYSWDVEAKDTDGAVSSQHAPMGPTPCRFTVDHQAPPSPKVDSTDFPKADGTDASWSQVRFGTGGDFTFSSTDGGAVDHYEYSFNWTSFGSSVDATADGSVTVTAKPQTAGPNVLYIRAVDSVGNVSQPAAYRFYVTPREQLDVPGDTNGDGHPDLLTIDADGRLKVFPGNERGDLHSGMDASYESTDDGYQPTPDGYWTGALITHNGDWLPGDGIQDLVARVDGGLYIYPGDGYSGFDVSKRVKVLLPDNAPAPSELTQILSIGDATGDGHPDMFANAGPQLWIFTGYSGGSFASAHQMTKSAWDGRDIVLVEDMTGDGTADLVYRTYGSGRLYLREGKPDDDGTGTDLLSLGLAATSRTGSDAVYGQSSWEPSNVPMLIGTPDATGDGTPDTWVMFPSGNVYVYPGGPTTHGDPYKVIDLSAEGTNWTRPEAIG